MFSCRQIRQEDRQLPKRSAPGREDGRRLPQEGRSRAQRQEVAQAIGATPSITVCRLHSRLGEKAKRESWNSGLTPTCCCPPKANLADALWGQACRRAAEAAARRSCGVRRRLHSSASPVQ
jgi:hypothetical protein